jgi:hypothetical protein
MAKNSDNNDGGPITGLNRKRIIEAWNAKKNLRQIAIETGLTIRQINRCVKETEKAVIQPGVKSHAKKIS